MAYRSAGGFWNFPFNKNIVVSLKSLKGETNGVGHSQFWETSILAKDDGLERNRDEGMLRSGMQYDWIEADFVLVHMEFHLLKWQPIVG